MTTPLTDTPARATWTGFGEPQRFLWRGTSRQPNTLSGHYIGRVDEVGGRLHFYDLNNILRADVDRSARFWAAVAYPLTADGHRADA